MAAARAARHRVDRKLLRILDANLNRAREGLRVCEDVARLGYDDEEITAGLKRLRHRLNGLVRTLPLSWRDLLAARGSDRDVGRRTPHLTSQRGAGVRALFLVNAQRSKEALRVLEEGARIFSPAAARRLAALRFRLYDLEKRFACCR